MHAVAYSVCQSVDTRTAATRRIHASLNNRPDRTDFDNSCENTDRRWRTDNPDKLHPHRVMCQLKRAAKYVFLMSQSINYLSMYISGRSQN